MSTSLENKTIRPGSLLGYSYYHSSRQPMPAARPVRPTPQFHVPVAVRRAVVALLILATLIFLPMIRGGSQPANVPVITPPATSHNAAAALPKTECSGNQLNQAVVVSIGQRHLWACEAGKIVYDTPVVTGIDYLAADKTPTGTFHITAKQTDQTLTGTDTTGSWSDPVKYWMPFLTNKYGAYGFHDATWRDNSAFGNISPNSADASHGCVELPLSASAWLYNWAQVGTTVTIKS